MIKIVVIEKAQVKGVTLYSQLFCNKHFHSILKSKKANNICTVDLV